MKQLTHLISALILGLSIIISAFIFSNTYSNSASEINNSQTITNSMPNLMTKIQLFNYLQISEQKVENIIRVDGLEKAKLGGYDTYQFIPYLKIGDQERFIKTEIDKWLKYKNDYN